MARIKVENLAYNTQELFGNEIENIVGGVLAPVGDPTYLEDPGFNRTDTGTGGNRTEYGIIFVDSDTDSGTNDHGTTTATRD